MEKAAYAILALVAVAWLVAVLAGLIAAFPYGLPGLLALFAIGLFAIGLRALVGGEIGEYTKMLGESREQALDRMIQQAQALGADGIVCIRFTTSAVLQGSAELLAYGTAVKLRRRA